MALGDRGVILLGDRAFLAPERLRVVADIGAAASPGETIGFEITASTDVVITGTDPVYGTYPMALGVRLIFGMGTWPYAESFDGTAPPINLTWAVAAGDYPAASAAGATVTTVSSRWWASARTRRVVSRRASSSISSRPCTRSSARSRKPS